MPAAQMHIPKGRECDQLRLPVSLWVGAAIGARREEAPRPESGAEWNRIRACLGLFAFTRMAGSLYAAFYESWRIPINFPQKQDS